MNNQIYLPASIVGTIRICMQMGRIWSRGLGFDIHIPYASFVMLYPIIRYDTSVR